VGSDRTVRVDVRVIAATNADLLSAVADRRFREDLYYRLAVFPIHLPPLRERREDIEVIAGGFLESLARRTGGGPWRLSERSKRWLEEQNWSGNVRELVNTLERATILSSGPTLVLDAGDAAPPPRARSVPDEPDQAAPILTLEEMERRHIQSALERTGGKLYGEDGSARLLGINPSTLRSRMQKLGLGGARDFRAKG